MSGGSPASPVPGAVEDASLAAPVLPVPGRGHPLWRAVRRVFPVLAVVVAAVALQRLLGELTYRQIVAAVRAAPAERIAQALLLTVGAYGAQIAYELLGMRYAGARVSRLRAAFTGFCAYAVSNTLGNPLFTSTPLRFRLYGALGLSTLDVLRVVAFAWVSFWLGLLTVGSAALEIEAARLASLTGASVVALRVIGLALALVVAGYLVGALTWRGTLRVGQWSFVLPRPPLVAGQLVVSIVDWLLTAGVLYLLLPEGRPGFWVFLSFFVVASLAGVISHVPGGLGVFDAAMAFLLAEWMPAEHVAVALLGFRVVYYLLPFLLALVLLVVSEAGTRRRQLEEWARTSAGWLTPLAPSALALITFAAGAVLLVTGSAPELADRMRLVRRALPLPVFEVSHLLASVVGAALLFLARGLRRRLDAAFYLTCGLLAVGAVAAALRGFDWEEAAFLAFVLVFLAASRAQFYRRASLLAQPVSARWLGAVALVLAGAVWLGIFAHRQVDYRDELWWQFSVSGSAPRFLRASFAAASVLAIGGIALMLRPAPPPPRPPRPEEEEEIERIVAAAPRANATLAFLGDKSFLFNDARDAFVMYGMSGDSCVAMGDPVGPRAEWPELIWRFRELCDRYHERPVFYQVHPGSLSLYLDVGLTAFKLGESGRVALGEFGLEGGARKSLRGSHKRALREGLSFEVVPREQALGMLDELERISDDWLRTKNAREKAFSLGAFRRPYVEKFPYAIVRREGELVAFANVLATAGLEELTIDLMRQSEAAPPAVMDFLFIELMLWGRERGYAWFNLGMAPLAGLENHELAPLWNRLGGLVFRHGEHFYNFQGLREYKSKFDPVWEPRYLAMRGGLGVPGTLVDVAALISGGVSGLVAR